MTRSEPDHESPARSPRARGALSLRRTDEGGEASQDSSFQLFGLLHCFVLVGAALIALVTGGLAGSERHEVRSLAPFLESFVSGAHSVEEVGFREELTFRGDEQAAAEINLCTVSVEVNKVPDVLPDVPRVEVQLPDFFVAPPRDEELWFFERQVDTSRLCSSAGLPRAPPFVG